VLRIVEKAKTEIMSDTEQLLKPVLLDLVGEVRRVQRELTAELTDVQRAELGTSDHWTLKDLIAHLTFWTESSIHIQQLVLAGEPLPDLDNYQQHNDRVFQERHDLSWSEVIAASEAVYEALLTLVGSYSEAQLAGLDGFPKSQRTLWSRISGNCQHNLVHFSEYCIEHGDPVRAIAIQAGAVENSRRIADPRSAGYAVYNLACMYARTGDSANAVALLPDALKAAPDLFDWSKEDPDLMSLHGLPAYEALYVSA
jgi:hypothetical protein